MPNDAMPAPPPMAVRPPTPPQQTGQPAPVPGQPPAAPPPPMKTIEVFNAPLFAQAIQLLKDERQKGFRIDVETDSTVALDQQAEQQSRTEFLKVAGSFFQSSLPMMQAVPQMVPVLGKVFLWVMRAFPVGTELEGAFEDGIAKLEGLDPQALGGLMGGGQQAGKAQQMQMKQQIAQQQLQASQARTQAEITKAQLSAQSSQQDHQVDIATHQMDMQAARQDAALDTQRNQLEAQRLAQEEQLAQADHARALEQAQIAHSTPLAPQKLPFLGGQK